MKNIIEVENLTKKYGKFVAVNNISFKSKEGDVIAFLGPNGAGKTTTMRMLTCYMPATEGTARIEGFDIFKDSFKVRQRIGYAPEIPPLYPEMTVQSYLKFVAQIKQVNPKEISKKVDKAIDNCCLEEMRKRLISKLSRGYKQRVGIAQAIIHDPKVIILDEPTVGLDPNQVVEIRKMIKDLATERTVMISTHILSEAESICNHIIIINKGNIAGQGTWKELEEDLQELLVVKLKLNDLNEDKINQLKSIDSIKDVVECKDNIVKLYFPKDEEHKHKLIKFIADKNWYMDEFITEKMSLEEIFKRLTEKKKV